MNLLFEYLSVNMILMLFNSLHYSFHSMPLTHPYFC